MTENTKNKLTLMSDAEFQAMVDRGGTLTISQINARLSGPMITAAMLDTLRIPRRNVRAAVHTDARDYRLLCVRLAVRILRSGMSRPDTNA